MEQANKPRILLLSAYDAGSHKRWREQLVATQPDFDWHVLTLPPRFFRWRIRGNALSWLNEDLLQQQWDLLLVTSMVDLASIRGFHLHLAATPALLYMHENQFAYPPSASQHSSAEPKMVNLYSAVAADRVLFNSEWNRQSFLKEADGFLDNMPDAVPEGLVDNIKQKSHVVPVPIDDALYQKRTTETNTACPHLLWNHRWEYDKAPERLLALLDALKQRGQPFTVSVVGEQFRSQPEAFETIRQRHGSCIENFGYVQQKSDYHKLLGQADIVISTALHDFQGLAMLEAMAAGCLALAPERLAYPEYIPQNQLYRSFVDDPEKEARAAADSLIQLLEKRPAPATPDGWRLGLLRDDYQRHIAGLIKRTEG